MGALAACGQGNEPASADEAAGTVAAALASGDFSEVTLYSGSKETLEAGVENLHESFPDLVPDITVAEVILDEPSEESVRAPTAEVSFQHRWDLEDLGIDGEEWQYTTTADFTYDEEADVWLLTGEADIILPDYAGHEPIGMVTTSAERGRIMDDHGRAMVYNRDVVRIGIDKSLFFDEEDEEETYRQAAYELAEVVGIDAELYAEQVLAYGDEAFVEAIVVRRDSTEITAADVENISGVATYDAQIPLAESSDFAPLLLGRVGPVTAEHLENDPTLQVGDMVGLSGIQSQHEDVLRGSPGVRIHKDGETLWSADPQPGDDLATKLNPRLQNLAQEIIGDQETTAALLAIRPSDGGILAAASHSVEDTFVDTATQSTYAPGSTFKVVSALAMLRDGLTPDSTVSCPDTTTVHGQGFGNVSSYPGEFLGSITFRDAVALSCNTVFADAWDDVTSAEVHQAALDLGLSNDTPIGLPALMGSIPDDSDLNLHAANLFGQGVVETSTLGMATVAASISAGHTVHPHVVTPEEMRELDGDLSEDEAEQLRTLMTDTVTFGTLQSMEEVPGEQVYAKTGTAEAGDGDDTYAHTWVIAIHGDLAVAIFLEEGEFGGSTNGPLLHQFLTGAYEILQD